MNSSINWGRLYSQGRCKDIGVSWSEEDMEAIYGSEKVPFEYVRRGCHTQTEMADMIASDNAEQTQTGKKSLIRMTLDELIVEAQSQGLQFDSSATPRATLMTMVASARKQPADSSPAI